MPRPIPPSLPILLLALLLVVPAAAQGPTLVPDRLEAFELEDQHGAPGRVGEDVRVLLLSRDMDGGAVVREALESKGENAAAYLSGRGAVYVADVSRMPGFVRTLFALPSMRRRPYPMLLDTTGDVTRPLPSEEGRATVLWLDALRPLRIEFVDSPEALLEKLGPAPAP